MSAPSPARLKALFDEALDLDAAARRARLEALRRHEPELAERLAHLLACDAGAADPFGNVVAELGGSLAFDEAGWTGRAIGGFRLLRLLGEGGMGAVFLAERERRDFQQKVAIKLLRGRWFDRRALERFAAERRILARLRHPNVAALVDAGASDEGVPYLVMEYVEGVPLDAYCDERRLDVRARVQLARGLLSALAHAHRALIVHRDLKPGNVLVTADGTPKLLDFGIARLSEADAPAAATVQIACTPDYASPEQLAGEPVGTGSDLYSFGLLLYELCAGVLPWNAGRRPPSAHPPPAAPSLRFRQLDAARQAELARRRGMPPSQLARRLGGDLGRILARCLEADPARRYAGAEALDADLAALLDGRPPPGVQVPRRERVLRFARRRAWPLALVSLALVAGLALLAQALAAAHRLAEERDRALAAAAAARVEAAKSERIAGFVQVMLTGVDPDNARGRDPGLLRAVLDRAAERAGRELDGQPAVHAVIERTIAAAYNAIGEYALSLAHYDAALAAAARGDLPAEQRIGIRLRKARVLGNVGRLEEALALAQAVSGEAAALPPTSRTRLLAEASLAGLECDAGRFERCRERFARVLPVQRSALGDDDEDTQESVQGLAVAMAGLGRYDEAGALYRELIERCRRRYGEGDPHVLRVLNSLAINEMEAGRYPQAEALLRQGLPQAERAFGSAHPMVQNFVSNLGAAIRQQPGRNAEARPYYERALTMMLAQYGPDSQRTVFARTNLALLLRDAGELAEAERQARAAVAHLQPALGADSPYGAAVLDALASVLIRMRRYAEAEALLARAQAMLAKADADAAPSIRRDVASHHVELYAATHRPRLAAEWAARRDGKAGAPR